MITSGGGVFVEWAKSVSPGATIDFDNGAYSDCVVVAKKKRWWPSTTYGIIIIGTIDRHEGKVDLNIYRVYRVYHYRRYVALSHGPQWTGVCL